MNLYGATKLCAEKLFVSANAYRRDERSTIFSVVRYGNVIGSRGSLVEIIRAQRESGKITLTDERMTRFWVKIDDILEIILRALEVMEGGEIFVPKMKSLPVRDVIACVAPECAVETIGIRPGEKIHSPSSGAPSSRGSRARRASRTISCTRAATSRSTSHPKRPGLSLGSTARWGGRSAAQDFLVSRCTWMPNRS